MAVVGRLPKLAAFAGLALFLAAAAPAGGVNPRLGNDVVPAPFGYEPITGKYTVAETTQVYFSPYIYPGTVDKTKLRPGQAVDALAKAKDYDWILIGKIGRAHV